MTTTEQITLTEQATAFTSDDEAVDLEPGTWAVDPDHSSDELVCLWVDHQEWGEICVYLPTAHPAIDPTEMPA